jgi:hypothetical protein
MRDREVARLAARRAAATHVLRNAWPQSGGRSSRLCPLVHKPDAARQSYRAVNRIARVRQIENTRDFSGKMTRAVNELDVADVAEDRSRRRGEACGCLTVSQRIPG